MTLNLLQTTLSLFLQLTRRQTLSSTVYGSVDVHVVLKYQLQGNQHNNNSHTRTCSVTSVLSYIWPHHHIMWADLWKGPFRAETKFLFFKAVIATGLKPGMTILQSLHYTRCKFRAPPISGLGVAVASVARGRKSAVLCLTLELHHFR